MLEHKRIEYDLVNLPPGAQPVALRLAGFRGRTVPALQIDGQRVQGSLAISRAIEALKADPPLFPADRRAAVEEAEAWGERELQPLPRRFFRWGVSNRSEVRRWLAEESRLPAAAAVSTPLTPAARYFARLSRADDENTRAGVDQLVAALDRVDALIADGTIGHADQPTAADFQIASSIAVLRGFSDLGEEWLAPLRRG